jgi:hypothetical protein
MTLAAAWITARWSARISCRTVVTPERPQWIRLHIRRCRNCA